MGLSIHYNLVFFLIDRVERIEKLLTGSGIRNPEKRDVMVLKKLAETDATWNDRVIETNSIPM